MFLIGDREYRRDREDNKEAHSHAIGKKDLPISIKK